MFFYIVTADYYLRYAAVTMFFLILTAAYLPLPKNFFLQNVRKIIYLQLIFIQLIITKI